MKVVYLHCNVCGKKLVEAVVDPEYPPLCYECTAEPDVLVLVGKVLARIPDGVRTARGNTEKQALAIKKLRKK